LFLFPVLAPKILELLHMLQCTAAYLQYIAYCLGFMEGHDTQNCPQKVFNRGLDILKIYKSSTDL